jgi:hypothetical protein
MASLWFYQPVSLLGKLFRSEFTHVAVMHKVSDQYFLTDARGGRVRVTHTIPGQVPAAAARLPMPDLWVTEWLMRQWGYAESRYMGAGLVVQLVEAAGFEHQPIDGFVNVALLPPRYATAQLVFDALRVPVVRETPGCKPPK